MASIPIAEWYYVGHYGQLGPLMLDQMEELVRDGVIARETYVWRTGMADWTRADHVQEFAPMFQPAPSTMAPPPPPMPSPPPATPYGTLAPAPFAYPVASAPRSDKNRLLAGILQLIIPGAGRLYLGYAAYGVLQFVLTPCGFFIGYIWSLVDGVIILSGGLKQDGYGRVLSD